MCICTAHHDIDVLGGGNEALSQLPAAYEKVALAMRYVHYLWMRNDWLLHAQSIPKPR